jgi:hypothetical protein
VLINVGNDIDEAEIGLMSRTVKLQVLETHNTSVVHLLQQSKSHCCTVSPVETPHSDMGHSFLIGLS